MWRLVATAFIVSLFSRFCSCHPRCPCRFQILIASSARSMTRLLSWMSSIPLARKSTGKQLFRILHTTRIANGCSPCLMRKHDQKKKGQTAQTADLCIACRPMLILVLSSYPDLALEIRLTPHTQAPPFHSSAHHALSGRVHQHSFRRPGAGVLGAHYRHSLLFFFILSSLRNGLSPLVPPLLLFESLLLSLCC